MSEPDLIECLRSIYDNDDGNYDTWTEDIAREAMERISTLEKENTKIEAWYQAAVKQLLLLEKVAEAAEEMLTSFTIDGGITAYLRKNLCAAGYLGEGK